MIDDARFQFDNNLRIEKNISYISGSDEAGRGAMAGPLVVASVILPPDYVNEKINDSKKIPERLREELFLEIKNIALAYEIGVYDNHFVDLNNPKKTSKIGMQDTINKLKIKPQLCLLDAEKIEVEFPSMPIIKGDAKSQTIAAASILAKVTRDHMMIELGKKYPQYGLEKHKGYCTKAHTENLKKYGVVDCYRVTYRPVKDVLEGK
jgi:ribonuclease HII